MRFQVPQFIEVEDKIFGPFTFKQFLYLAGGAGIIVVLFSLLPRFVAIILSMPVLALSLSLTFYKPNNRPFITMVEAFFNYFVNKKLYIWKKESKKRTAPVAAKGSAPAVSLPKLSQSKLKDLSWSISIKGQKSVEETRKEMGLE